MALSNQLLKQLSCVAISPRLFALGSNTQSISRHLSSAQPGGTTQQQASFTEQYSAQEQASSAQQSTGAASEQTASSSDSTSQQSSSESGTKAKSSHWTQQFSQTFKGGFEGVKSRFKAGTGGESTDSRTRVERLFQAVTRELKDALLPVQEEVSVTRMYEGPVATPTTGGPTDLVLSPRKETSWQKMWNDMKEKYGHHPLFRRLSDVKLSDNTTYKKGQEMADNLRERWETADHPIVHKVEDMRERYFTPSEAARTMQEILNRDPKFNMNQFISHLNRDAPLVVKAFLLHDIGTLKKHCGPELIERFSGIFKHFNEQGLHEDPTILFTSDVELVQLQMVDEEPLVVVRFSCQQLRCTRDKFGNIVEGSMHDIQRVFYFWGLSQDRESVVTADGKLLPPRWVIKDMMWQSMLALV